MAEIVKIAVDAMGGEYSPKKILPRNILSIGKI